MVSPMSTCAVCLEDYDTDTLNKKMVCQSCLEVKLSEAIDIVLDDLTEYNAHTIAALLENHYRSGYDQDKMLKAYKAAQLEIFGTQ